MWQWLIYKYMQSVYLQCCRWGIVKPEKFVSWMGWEGAAWSAGCGTCSVLCHHCCVLVWAVSRCFGALPVSHRDRLVQLCNSAFFLTAAQKPCFPSLHLCASLFDYITVKNNHWFFEILAKPACLLSREALIKLLIPSELRCDALRNSSWPM